MINTAVVLALSGSIATVLGGFIFDNVTALLASTVHPNKCPAWILYETTPGDGTVGFYVYLSASMAVHNPPAVIEPNDVGPALPGRWHKQF
jgi:hypothetical protein